VLVAPSHELREEHRARPADRELADLADNEDRGMREHLESRLQTARGLGSLQ
jgi:hypothetical protein